MKSRHGGTRGVWVVWSIVGIALLSLVLGGCGGAGSVPGATGDTSRTGGDPATGEALGTVRNPASQAPIQGVTVTIAGKSDVTGANGQYHITGISPVGVHTVTCVAPGWTMPGAAPSVEIAEGPNLLDDLYMTTDGSQPPPLPTF